MKHLKHCQIVDTNCVARTLLYLPERETTRLMILQNNDNPHRTSDNNRSYLGPHSSKTQDLIKYNKVLLHVLGLASSLSVSGREKLIVLVMVNNSWERICPGDAWPVTIRHFQLQISAFAGLTFVTAPMGKNLRID
ncbi:hypothetical protein JTE90_007121 [Oedothorax gibbosus]|uniref:Uncharacterized protein n=1 Tax=Oedothorax gibbosus TaxID=931172 RepID=A0AAV6VRX0_9ARAC|nr:hypothetical protein JTE90_007121 [Oedothorax gibbosus]